MPVEARKSQLDLVHELEKLREENAVRRNELKRYRDADLELARTGRALAMISACQRVLVRSRDKAELLNQICEVIVEVGGFSMVWVGLAGHDGEKSVRPLGWAGDVDGFFDGRTFTWDNSSRDLGPEGKVIAEGTPVVIQDILSNPDVLRWRGEAIKRGYASVAALPLKSRAGTVGALVVYAGENRGFASEDIEIMQEVADNLVYGIRALHTNVERIRAEKEVKNSILKLRQTLGAIIQVLEQTVEVRDPYTAGHQRRVAELARTIGEEMGLANDRIDGLRIAGIIHDIGKIYVPAEILSKPRALSPLEFSLIKTHPQVGFDMLKVIDFPWPVSTIVLQHHERIDGSGYPNHLAGDKILLEARILGVADVVEAMASHRPYRPALGVEAALDEVTQMSGRLYDPEVVDVCVRVFKEKKFEFMDTSFSF